MTLTLTHRAQPQAYPGASAAMSPQPDHGEESYRGSGRLAGKTALITGADSGIGRAVAIAYAREGTDIVISYLDEHEDAHVTAQWVERAGRNAVLVPGDISEPSHAVALVTTAVEAFGRNDVLANNAGYRECINSTEDISIEDWNRHFAVNVHALLYIVKAALPQIGRGGSIANTASMNATMPMQRQFAYSSTKAAITNFTANLAKFLAPKGIRVNAVLPGSIRTPLINSTTARRR